MKWNFIFLWKALSVFELFQIQKYMVLLKNPTFKYGVIL